MSWNQKLTESGYKTSDFGVAFNKKVTEFERYTADVNILKKQLSEMPDGARGKKQLERDIKTYDKALSDLDKSLCSTIAMWVKDPERMKKNKERMASIRKGAKAVKTETPTETAPTKVETTSAPAEQKPAETKVETSSPPAEEKPKPTETKPVTDPPKQAPAKPVTTEKKKSGGIGILGWILIAFGIGAGVGVVVGKAKK